MSKNVFVAIGVVLVLLAGIGYYTYARAHQAPVHYHAGFKVFVDDNLQDFSNIKYMTIAPCREEAEVTKTAKEIQNDKGHLHDNVGTVVHVHESGGTWGDLFTNIHYTFPKDKPIFAFINGRSVEDILHTPIKPYDSIVIFVGTRDKIKEELKQAVTIDYIKQIEKKSELCGTGVSSHK